MVIRSWLERVRSLEILRARLMFEIPRTRAFRAECSPAAIAVTANLAVHASTDPGTGRCICEQTQLAGFDRITTSHKITAIAGILRFIRDTSTGKPRFGPIFPRSQ